MGFVVGALVRTFAASPRVASCTVAQCSGRSLATGHARFVLGREQRCVITGGGNSDKNGSRKTDSLE